MRLVTTIAASTTCRSGLWGGCEKFGLGSLSLIHEHIALPSLCPLYFKGLTNSVGTYTNTTLFLTQKLMKVSHR